MVRLIAAAALATLLAAPAWAQTVSPGESSGSGTLQNQGQSQSSPPVPGQSESLSRDPGQIPADCTPNDPRPECQTAQLPGQDSPDQSVPDQGGAGVMTPPAREAEPEAPSGQGGEMNR